MGLAISILFPSYLELFECVKNRVNLLSCRDLCTFRNISNHAPEHTKWGCGTFQITLRNISNHAIFEVQSRYFRCYTQTGYTKINGKYSFI